MWFTWILMFHHPSNPQTEFEIQKLKRENEVLHARLKSSLMHLSNHSLTTIDNKETVIPPVIPVLLLTHDRASYLERSLSSITKYIPEHYPLIISQDGDIESVKKMIQQWKEKHAIVHIQHLDRSMPKTLQRNENVKYYFISRHYHFALSYVFDTLKYSSVIILEEDLEIAPDFFEYFEAMRNLLEEDSTLFCASGILFEDIFFFYFNSSVE